MHEIQHYISLSFVAEEGSEEDYKPLPSGPVSLQDDEHVSPKNVRVILIYFRIPGNYM